MLPYDLFIRSKLLTETSHGVTTSLWPKIEEYVINPETWKQKLLASIKWVSKTSDPELETLIKQHFNAILNNSNFNLVLFSLELFEQNEYQDNYGTCSVEILNAAKKEIKVKIKLALFRMQENSGQNILRTLYHELIHIEQDVKAIQHISCEKLYDTIPVFTWLEVDEVLGKRSVTNELEYVNRKDEIDAYSHDLALQLFYKYKPEFKNQTATEQDLFIRTKIIPNIKNEFSYEVKTNVLDALNDNNKHKFYISLIKQLQNFAVGVIRNV